MNLVREMQLDIINDGRGELSVFESMKNIPFDIKRVYCLTATKHGISRGFHAHRKLSQVLVCIQGKCRVVFDDGTKREEKWLSSKETGVFVKTMIWRELHDFSDDCVLMVLASELYEQNDYICDYQVFLNETRDNSLPLTM